MSLQGPFHTTIVSLAGGCCMFVSAAEALAGGCTPSTGPDVIVGDINGVSNYTNVGGIDAFAVGTTSCNIGNVNLLWNANATTHPVIPQNMYRLRTVDGAGQFEQIGQGWMKHAFTALTQNLCCTCNGAGGSVLGVGCSDPYTSGRNGTQAATTGGLGPRFQVNAHTGGFIWPYQFRANSTYIPQTSITRRVQVNTSDLNPALNSGALYYVEAQYVTPDDATAQNQNNNASYRRITISGADPNYTASMTGGTVREMPAITAWKVNDPSVIETKLFSPEALNNGGDTTGHGVLAARATDLGGGVWHYEYAVYNMNSDRSFSSFSVPSSPGLVVTNIGFHDVDYHSGDGYNSQVGAVVNFDGTDWPGANDGSNISWALVPAVPLENSNALRWGTMYNFRFDANSPPTTGSITLGLFKAVVGQPDTMLATGTVVPMGIEPCAADVTGNGTVNIDDLLDVINAWGSADPSADVDDDGDVDIDDLLDVINAWGDC
jgi:hypothetical protein